MLWHAEKRYGFLRRSLPGALEMQVEHPDGNLLRFGSEPK